MNFNLRNNKGYALVTVLLIITIFMIFGLTFMTQSFNTTKQVKATENRVQAIDLAEMGVEFFNKFITNNFGEITNKAEQKFLSSLNNKEDITDLDIEKAKENAIKEAYNSLKSKLEKMLKEDDDDNDNELLMPIDTDISYKITDLNISKLTDKKTIVSFESIGSVKENNESIESEIEIDFSNIFVRVQEEKEIRFSIDELAPDEEFEVQCDVYENRNKVDLSNKKCRYNQSKEFKNDLTASNTILKVNGDLELKNDFNSAQNKDSKSKLYITGNYTGHNHNNLSHAEFYVGDTVEIEKLQNSTNVKICTNNLAKIPDINSNNAKNIKIYVMNKNDSIKEKDINDFNGTGNENEIKVGKNAIKECTNKDQTGSNSGEIHWNFPVISNKSYIYDS